MKNLFTLGILLALMTFVPVQNTIAQTDTKLQVTLTTEAGQPGYITCPQEHSIVNPGESDGGGVPAMIDGNPGTYMHTAWKNVPAGPHYFQIDLGADNTLDSFAFYYQTRNGDAGYDFPAEFTIKGSNDNSNYEQITVVDVGDDMIGAGLEYDSERINSSKAYRYLRFEVTDADDVYNSTGNRTYFHIAEFKLYKYEDYVPQYSVTVSVNDAAMGSAAKAITGEETYSLTATANSGYSFVNWTIAGSEVSRSNPFSYTATEDVEIVANFVKEYCAIAGNMSTSDRNFNSFILTDGSHTVEVTGIQTAGGALYSDMTNYVLTTAPGATLSFSDIDWNGNWMQGYVFIDYNQDIEFNNTANNDGTTGGELVTYNCYNIASSGSKENYGTNILGEETYGGDALIESNMPSWTLPSNLAIGDYRLRFNVAWNSIDPCGYSNMATDRGAMVDITLRIEQGVSARSITLEASPAEGGVVTANGTEGGLTDVSGIVTITASPNEGYVFVNWINKETSEVVSTNATFSNNEDGDVTYVANFERGYCSPSVTTQGSNSSYVGQIVTLTTTGAVVDANWTNPYTEDYNGSTSVIENTFTAEAGQTITLNIADKNTVWGYVRIYADLNGNYLFDADEQVFADADRNRTEAINQTVTIAEDVEVGTYLMRVFYVGGTGIAEGACGNYTEGGYYDFKFNVTAPFVLDERTITVKANNDAWGTVTGGATSTGRVTIAATANEGYEFVNWAIEGNDTFTSTSAIYIDDTEGDKTYVATFEMLPADDYTLALIDAAKELLAQDGVGFPSDSERALLQSAVAVAEANPYAGAATALQTAINAYMTTANVKIPEAGKAYAFVSAVSEDQLFYMYNNDGTLSLADYTMDADFVEEAKFLCSIVDNKYVFQSVKDNKYIAYPTKETETAFTGVSNTGLEAELQVISKFDVDKLSAGANENVDATAEQLFGMLYMTGTRGYKNGVAESAVIVVKNDKTFDAAGEPFCDGTYTSALRIVEVSYTLSYAVSAESSPADGGQVTISANKVEENGTVELTATANEGYNFVNWTVEGVEVSTSESFTSESITTNTTFVANFVKETYTVTVTATAGGTATSDAVNPVEYGTQITLVANANSGYEFVGWMVDGSEGAKTFTWTVPVTEDLDFVAQFRLIQQGEKDVTVYDATEENDASYTTVSVANEKVWDLQAYNVVADKVSVKVESNGAAPEIKFADGGQVTTTLEVSRIVEKGKWALMSLPFAVDLANVTVNGVAAVNNSNIKVMVYDAAYRAANSIELFTKSGWKELTGTTIAANQGFAVAINANNGDEQTVTFTSASQIYDGSDKQIALSRYASTVNGGADADWNFYGNPTLAKAQKGTGYALYVYNAEDDSYDEYASSDVATYQPYAAWFVQSADDFNAMSFSAGVAGALAEADGVFGELQFTLNDDDEARIVLVDESSEEYVRNEDALYFPAINTNLSQLYLVKGNIKMAVSEQPSLTSMAMGYKAVKSGEQTLTLTSVPENTSVVLVDNVAGTETSMTLGDTYTFQSEAGTFNNRFVIETTDLTGISQAVADGEVKVLVNGTEINVYGAEAGTEVVAYTTNGTVVASAVAEEGVTTLSTTASGVIVVKVANTAVKVLK